MIEHEIIRWLRGDIQIDPLHEDRQAALDVFQTWIGRRIYIGRVPKRTPDGYTCVVNRIQTARSYGLYGEVNAAAALVQFDIRGKDPEASTRTQQIADQLRKVLSTYRGMLGDTYMQTAEIERESMLEDEQADGSNEFRYSLDFEIHYTQDVVLTPLASTTNYVITDGGDYLITDAGDYLTAITIGV